MGSTQNLEKSVGRYLRQDKLLLQIFLPVMGTPEFATLACQEEELLPVAFLRKS